MEKIYKLELKSGRNVVEHNVIIETANKIINNQAKSVMLDFFLQIVVIYASKRWREVGTPCIFHSR